MKTGASLTLICIGAILAFAVTGNTSFFNVHTAGWVLMLIGVIGLLLPKRTGGWLGRRLLVRRTYPGGQGQQAEHAPLGAAHVPSRRTRSSPDVSPSAVSHRHQAVGRRS